MYNIVYCWYSCSFRWVLPYKNWNNNAILTICHQKGAINQVFCYKGGVTQFCYQAWIILSAVSDCGQSRYAGTYNTKEQANTWLSRFIRTYNCYYVPNDKCNPSLNLKDTLGTLIAGTVFTVLGFVFLAIWLIVMYRKRRNYEQIFLKFIIIPNIISNIRNNKKNDVFWKFSNPFIYQQPDFYFFFEEGWV